MTTAERIAQLEAENAALRAELAAAFCRIRSYLSTMRKQGRAMSPALSAVFLDRPFPIAWDI